ncbi:MAG TPA: CYTH domain-containing protein [Solirubrobacterales bacterium]|nr:CYTH domain-containing protein [Solirubrobacterales bacterium]
MATEIERKFLLDEPPDGLQDHTAKRIEQGYLAIRESVEVRLRKLEDRRLLTAKVGHGESRVEVEIPLGINQFDALWPLTESRRLRKTRYLVPLGDGLVAEVDVFEEDLAGLVTAEVEFDSERQSHEFQPPGWLGKEVTGDGRYANQSLASAGVQLFSSRQNGSIEIWRPAPIA